MGKVSTSFSGGALFKMLNEGGRGNVGIFPGIEVSGLELSLLFPPSLGSCIPPIEGGLMGLGVLGWSQSELGFEADLEGELPMFWFLCVRACCFMLP